MHFLQLLGKFEITLMFLLFPLFRLDVYIHDYLLKRKLHNSAKAFMAEGKVATDPVGNVDSYLTKIFSARAFWHEYLLLLVH